MHSVCIVVKLHVNVNYIKILSVAQQWCYGKYMSLTTISTSLFLKKKKKKKLNSKKFALFSHVTYKRCIETKERSFAQVLLET